MATTNKYNCLWAPNQYLYFAVEQVPSGYTSGGDPIYSPSGPFYFRWANSSTTNAGIGDPSSGLYPTRLNNAFWNNPDELSREFKFTTTSVSIGLTGLWGPWNNTPSAGAWPETFAYPSAFSKASLAAVQSAASSYRSEVNAQLQQYIQDTQSKKTDIDNTVKAMQNVVSQTTQAVTNQINIAESLMQTMKSIIMAMFP